MHLERERVKKIYYEIGRNSCPHCRRSVSGRVGNVLARVALSSDQSANTGVERPSATASGDSTVAGHLCRKV